MKKIEVNIVDDFKAYKKGTKYSLEGELVILSGINGSGKSQLLKIIANNSKEHINREVILRDGDGNSVLLENIFLISFRDNIDLGDDFGNFSVTFQKNNAQMAWEFYRNNIKHINSSFQDASRTKKFKEGTLIFDNKGIKNSSWRSIVKLVDLINKNYEGDKVFNLSQFELEKIIPVDFIWRNENDLIELVGNLFYMACCERVDRQIACSETTEIFNNEEWLKTAPWTILNKLFADLKFKYRFKQDYSFNTPYMEENPKLRMDNSIRGLNDLSDGEKAILKLALISLDEEISKDIDLVLFDEYDAPLNPSLTEAFYHVIDKFYITKGIQVIITTHSPATISLAPDYAQFYEIFQQEDSSPKIVKVNQYDYEELKIANRTFYDRIKNQEKRIYELEQRFHNSEKMVFVEDKYDQIYKIAYLKIKGIKDINQENFEEKFKENCEFSIHGGFSCGGLYSELVCSNISADQNKKVICLFDFDTEGYRKYKDLADKKDNKGKLYPNKGGSLRDGLYMKHAQANRHALMLPIPERLEKYVSVKTSSDCFIEVETLLSEEYLKTNIKAEQRSEVLPFYKMKDSNKKDFWMDLFSVDAVHFQDFVPLFSQIENIFSIIEN